MDTSLKLQMDVKNNAEDLREYMLSLQNWEERMKKKDMELKNGVSKVADIPPPRNKIKRNISGKSTDKSKSSDKEKPKKIRAYDYAAWDKYDADKACAELDEEEEKKEESVKEAGQEKEEEDDDDDDDDDEGEDDEKVSASLKNLDEAFYEKELGNQLVRKEKWSDAIKCYSRAIDLDPKNPIYYANRSICFIKLKKFKEAEVDATVAIQLDSTYLKAYQRRGLARTALGQLEEAKSDYEQILKLDPKNALANCEITKINQRLKMAPSKIDSNKSSTPLFNPKNIFNSYVKEKNKEHTAEKVPPKPVKKAVEVKSPKVEEVTSVKPEIIHRTKDVQEKKDVMASKELKDENRVKKEEPASSIFPPVPEGFTIVKPVYIPPHRRSKEPLQRIPIKDVMSDAETFDEFFNLLNDTPEANSETIPGSNSDTIATNVISKETKYEVNLDDINFPVPETCVQFQQAWKLLRTSPRHCYSYLKKIKCQDLSRIFKHSLESDLFSDLISTLSHEETLQDSELVYNFLFYLSTVQRFGSLVLFMSSEDKQNLRKCITSLKQNKLETEVAELCRLYEFDETV